MTMKARIGVLPDDNTGATATRQCFSNPKESRLGEGDDWLSNQDDRFMCQCGTDYDTVS